MSAIGDIILTTPVIRQLRQRFPHAQIDFLVRSEYAAILEADPHLTRQLIIDVRRDNALSEMRKHIQREQYDVILDLHRNLRSVWLTAFSGNATLYKLSKNRLLRHLLVNYKINLYQRFYPQPLSVAEKYLRAAAPLGVDPKDTRLSLNLAEDDRRRVSLLWKEWGRQGFRAVMAPGARHFTKRWPAIRYADLVRALHEKEGWKTILVGGPDERDTCEAIRRRAPDLCLNLAGELSLPETFAVIARAGCFVSNDSGLMHAAAALNVPQVAIFGSTVRELGFFPINNRAAVVENAGLACRPCSHIGKGRCPKSHFRCMHDITPETVLAAGMNALHNERKHR